MPVIPLYTPTNKPLASHHVTSPGGYEWWQFIVGHPDDEQRAQIDIFNGVPFDHAYRRAYARYRRAPTRNAPPQPAQYPLTRFWLVRAQGPTTIVHKKTLPEDFKPDELLQSDGSVMLQCSIAGSFSISLRFAPRSAWSLPPNADLSSPQCDVQGKIVLEESGETVELTGVGSIRQRFGTKPINWRA